MNKSRTINEYRTNYYGEVEVDSIESTSATHVAVKLKQPYISIYKPRSLSFDTDKLLFALEDFFKEQSKIESGIVLASFDLERNGIVYDYSLLDCPASLKKAVYKNVEFNPSKWKGHFIFPSEFESANYRFCTCILSKKTMYKQGLKEGSIIPGHIFHMKYSTPQYEGHEPRVLLDRVFNTESNIYYVSAWCSKYKEDEDYTKDREAKNPYKILSLVSTDQDHNVVSVKL